MKKPSDFTARVYAAASRIPKGKVATYGQLAALAGRPGAARAVGTAMRNNPSRKLVPCHRVVGANGALTGYAFGKGIPTKQSMLTREGVKFQGTRVNLALSGWKG
jgi:O-6-methylguanine DNA methyltransferase